MSDGMQQQDPPPPRRRPAFPTPQPYQPRRHQQPQAPQASEEPLHQHHPAGRGGTAGGRSTQPGGGRGAGRGGRRPLGHAAPGRQQQRGTARQAMHGDAETGNAAVAALVDAASDATQPAAARAAALQQLHQRLFDPAAQREALQQLQALWPRLLATLWSDPSPAVSAAAAPAVGAIGALAAQAAAAAAASRAAAQAGPAAGAASGAGFASGSAGSSVGGLLFDWLLPVLQRRVTPSGAALAPHHLVAVLAALRDCLTGVDGVTLARYANAVLAACQSLLEDEGTPPAALPPLLAAVQQAARHQHSLRARFRDLVDLLLGWALEPALPDAARPALSRALASFGALWRHQPAFTASLLGSLLADLRRLAGQAAEEAGPPAAGAGDGGGGPGAPSVPPSLRQALALAACVLPILDAAVDARLPACRAQLQDLLAAFQSAVRVPAASAAHAGVAAELAGHVARLAALAPAAAAVAAAAPERSMAGEHVSVQLLVSGVRDLALSSGSQQEAGSAPGPEQVQLELLFEQQPAAGEGQASDPLQTLAQAALAFAAAAMEQPAVAAQQSAVMAVLAAVRAWVQLLTQRQQQQLQAVGGQEMAVDAAAAALLPVGTEGVPWLLSLRHYASREVVLQAAQLAALLAQHSPAALEALLADTEALAAGPGPAEVQEGAAGLLFDLSVLQASVPRLAPAGLSAVWQRLLPLALPSSALASGGALREQQPHRLWLHLLTLLKTTADQLRSAAVHDKGSVGPAAAGAPLQGTLQLVAGVLKAGAGGGSQGLDPVLLAVLDWLQHVAAWADRGPQGESGLQELTDLAAALSAALACAASPAAAVRCTALSATRAWVSTSAGSAALLQDAGLSVALFRAALLHLTDLHAPAAAEAEQLLLAAAAPLALSGALCPVGSGAECRVTDSRDAAAAALEPQQLQFRPVQLQQLLSYLSPGSFATPTVLSSGEQLPVNSLTDWLPRMLHYARGASPSTPPAHNRQPLCCLSQAAWVAVQEAAKQCVAARLRTPYGGPAQTLAALERALQQAAAGHQDQHNSRAGPAAAEQAAADRGKQQAAALLVLFLFALEQGISAAASGSGSRAASPQEAAAFFAANEKVCTSWFGRVRLLLLRTSAAAHLPHLAAYHGLQRLQDLQRQLDCLLPKAPAASGTGEEAAEARGGVLSPTAAGAMPPKTPLAGSHGSRLPGAPEAAAASNPAVALLAATRGSPDPGLREEQQQAGSRSAAGQRRGLSQHQLQSAAAKVADAAGMTAAALCTLGDAAGLEGLQAYCRSAFDPLLRAVQPATPGATFPPAADDGELAEAAAAAWDWLTAAREQAAGRYEAAVERYTQLFVSGARSSLQCVPSGTVARLVADAYTALGDPAGLRGWLQTKRGSRLPPEAADRCLELASWDAQPERRRTASAGTEERPSRLLQDLQLCSMDPAATLSASPASAAAVLAELSVAGSGAAELPKVPSELLLQAVAAANRQPSGEPLCAWQQAVAECEEEAAHGAAAGTLLQPLLLLGRAAPPYEKPLLLIAAAQAAIGGRNAACAQRLLDRAADGGRASPTGSSGDASAGLLERWQRLRLLSARDTDGSAAWQLLQEARATAAAAAVIPAAARLLLERGQAAAGAPAAEVAALLRSCAAPALSTPHFSRLESYFTGEGQLLQSRVVQYAALKACVASLPGSPQQWWHLAAWLHRQAAEGEEAGAAGGQPDVQAALLRAALTASCVALSLAAGGAGGGGGGGYEALPLLLQVLQLLPGVVQGSGGQLSPDTAAELAAVPAAAWLPVVPHLLSQLAGGEAASDSQAVHSLLVHVADAAPSQVLLPASVAAAAQPAGADALPGARLQAFVGELEQRHPRLARQLRVLQTEAARLAVLPEEHWHSVLQEAAASAARRLQAQQYEQAGGADSSTAGADAYLAALAPVLLCLQQQLHAAEAAVPETPHEQRFREEHLPRLRSLLRELGSPLATPPADAAGAQGLARAAQQRRVAGLLRGAASDLAAALRPRRLLLADVAPALASLTNAAIPVPGAVAAGATVAGVGGEVAVLPTKTRPKRLQLMGSDGAAYSFLLKGREDLRADARLMQVLRACRAALRAGGGDLAAMAVAQCFEVTPLGRRLGLIQWVEGTVPLFEVYTSWQERRSQRTRLLAAAAAAQQQQQEQHRQQQDVALHIVSRAALASKPGSKIALQAARGTLRGRVLAVPKQRAAQGQAQAAQHAQRAQHEEQLRPADLFYAKLREVGIDPASPRDSWPEAKLIRVLQAMQQTADHQLLHRELWLGAGSGADWWHRQRGFASSVAAMSVVGHLLGLGDRHLDNILLQRSAAQVVHIDFSVVFDRGLKLKVPEVVPFRLTPTLVAALGVTGVEGGFRSGCERALCALRANSPLLCALLEAALLDPGVDWDSEGAAKAGSKAFGRAVALQLFALRLAGGAAELSAVASSASASLAGARSALAAYLQQLQGAAGAAAAAAESHALVQRCQATLGSAEVQERALTEQADEARGMLAGLMQEAQPLAAQALASLQECQAWQARHDALLPLLLGNPPAAMLSGSAVLNPHAAAASGIPLLLVTSPAGGDASGGEGSGSIVQAALRVLPSRAPLSAGLLLQAAAADKQGLQLLAERAAAAGQLVAALQQYAAAVACLLGGAAYAATSQHAHWRAAFQAALDLPVPQGFERAAELAPHPPDPAAALHAWRPLAAAAAASAGLLAQLHSSAGSLQLERVDVALAASEARQHLLDAAAAGWAPAAGTRAGQEGPAELALAFAAYSEAQAAAVQQLAADQQRLAGGEEEEEGEEEDGSDEEPRAILAAVEKLVLGYAGTAVALRDATSEELFLGPAGGNLLAWLSDAVQAVDGLGTAAAELQLLLPPLLALLCAPAAAAQVSAAVAAAKDLLDGSGGEGPSSGGSPGQDELSGGIEAAAAAALEPLLAAAGQHPPLAGLLQGLEQAQAAAQLLLPAAERPSLAQRQLQLASAAVVTWQELEGVLEEAAALEGGGPEEAAAPAEPGSDVPWQQCGAVLASAVADEAAQHLLQPLAAALGSTSEALRAAAPSLARRAGLERAAPPPLPILPGAALSPSAAARAESPGLVPFTDFDAELPGASVLLGGLLDEGEEAEGQPGGGGGLFTRQPGEAAPHGGQEPQLVPFLDFDEALAGADDLLGGELEPGGAGGFEALEGGGGLSQQSEGEGEASGGGGGAPMWQLVAATAAAGGELAAVDAALYLTGLAAQQAQRARQAHAAELAAFQWANEHLLPPEAAAAAASLLAGVPLRAAGAPLPAVHPAVAGWALSSSRGQLLGQLRAGAATLLSLEAPLQRWQAQLVAAARQLAGEVAAAAPSASAELQQALSRQQGWLQAAASHAANLLEVAQAVLQLEAARTADSAAAAAAGDASSVGGDRYQAEQREGWRRYAALLQAMRQLHGSYAAAEARVALAASQLDQLQVERADAARSQQSAEAAGAAAAAGFAAAALPLVRATQQLAPALVQLLPRLAGCQGWAAQLERARRWAAELAGSGALPAADAAAAAEAVEQLAAAGACLQQLPAAVQGLQAALLPARNKLLAGGRGEAAAGQQAAGLVDALAPCLTQLAPQLHQAELAQRWLEALPTRLQALAASAAQQAQQAQRQHGFSLAGLQQLLGGRAEEEPPRQDVPPAGGTALNGSLVLASGAPAVGPAARREQQQQYADEVLQRFRVKLCGDRAGGDQEAVRQQVGRLIAAATSPARLARMYEGWMPWV